MEINNKREKLFNNPGYIKLSDYLTDIDDMRKNGPWKIPFGSMDKFQFFLLKIVSRVSWLSSNIYVEHPYVYSPAYSIIINYLRHRNLFKSLRVHPSLLNCSRYFLYGDIINGFELKGSGISFTSKELSFSKSLGELIERSVTGFFNEDKISVVSSFSDLIDAGKRVLYPPLHHRYLKIQQDAFPELRTSSNTKFEWVFGRTLYTNEEILIPRHLVFWGEKFDQRKSNCLYLHHPTTNGSAAHFNLHAAIKSGLLEVIQRDAFLVYWLTETAPDVIMSEGCLPELISNRINKIKERGIDLYLLDAMTDILVPTVCVVLKVDNSRISRVLVCASSDLTYERAIESALDEAAQAVDIICSEQDLRNKHQFIPFLDNLDKKGRVAIWSGKEWLKKFEWFLEGRETNFDLISKKDIQIELNNSYTDLQKIELDLLKNLLKNMGEEYSPSCYFPKSLITKDLGIHVVQVFVPICFPLYLVEKYGTFDSERLEIFSKLKNKKTWSLNKLPHPFP